MESKRVSSVIEPEELAQNEAYQAYAERLRSIVGGDHRLVDVARIALSDSDQAPTSESLAQATQCMNVRQSLTTK